MHLGLSTKWAQAWKCRYDDGKLPAKGLALYTGATIGTPLLRKAPPTLSLRSEI